MSVTPHLDLSYVSPAVAAASSPTSNRRQQLDLYVAPSSSSTSSSSSSSSSSVSPSPLPLLVYIHGGLWVDRDKSDYRFLGEHWSSTLNAHVALVNYRQSSKKEAAATSSPVLLHPTHTEDLLTALHWLSQADTQKRFSFATQDIFLVGHSCGGHMAGLVSLAVGGNGEVSFINAALLQSTRSALQSTLRGSVGIEGLFDCASFAVDFPDWSSGITDAFGTKEEKWESPQDYLPLTASNKEKKQGAARQRIQKELKEKQLTVPMQKPWLIIHSKEDPWVNMPQAENFHQGILALAEAQKSSSSSFSSSSSSAVPASTLVTTTGAHFEVIEVIGKEGRDQITAPLREFIRTTMAATKRD